MPLIYLKVIATDVARSNLQGTFGINVFLNQEQTLDEQVQKKNNILSPTYQNLQILNCPKTFKHNDCDRNRHFKTFSPFIVTCRSTKLGASLTPSVQLDLTGLRHWPNEPEMHQNLSNRRRFPKSPAAASEQRLRLKFSH